MGLFGGVIDTTKGNIMIKGIMKSLVKEMVGGDEEVPERIDLRDWEEIRIWTENLPIDPFEA